MVRGHILNAGVAQFLSVGVAQFLSVASTTVDVQRGVV